MSQKLAVQQELTHAEIENKKKELQKAQEEIMQLKLKLQLKQPDDQNATAQKLRQEHQLVIE